jgi:hypothetical protein
MNYQQQLLTNVGTVGAGTAYPWGGGAGVFSFPSGTVGGSTVKLQWSPDNGANYIDVDRTGDSYVTLTAIGAGRFDLPPCLIRGNVVGGSPSGINAYVQRIIS